MRQAKATELQVNIVNDLKQGNKTNEELCTKYGINYMQICRIMDGLGSMYPVYNPRPGVWAILGYENEEVL